MELPAILISPVREDDNFVVQVTALGAAVAAGSSLGIWTVGAKMAGITVYRYV